jgi:hypothetical protein
VLAIKRPSLPEYLQEGKERGEGRGRGKRNIWREKCRASIHGTSFRVLSVARLHKTAKISIDDGGDRESTAVRI